MTFFLYKGMQNKYTNENIPLYNLVYLKIKKYSQKKSKNDRKSPKNRRMDET